MVKPGDAQLFRLAQTNGAAAKVGDRVANTNIVFKEKSIYFEINGGPKKKTKWYQHIEGFRYGRQCRWSRFPTRHSPPAQP